MFIVHLFSILHAFLVAVVVFLITYLMMLQFILHMSIVEKNFSTYNEIRQMGVQLKVLVVPYNRVGTKKFSMKYRIYLCIRRSPILEPKNVFLISV